MEVDVVPSTVSALEVALPLYPFDYLLGAVHRVPDLPPEASPEDAYRTYYAALRWAAGTGLFQALAHPDRVHRRARPIPAPLLEELMAETAQTLARTGVAAEMSSAGLRAGFAGVDPHPAFVRLCRAHGVAITLGSDGHQLEAVGGGLAALRDLVWDAGYREIATFEGGRRTMRPLAAPPVAAVAP
jgi:histidinol-phosphatase (PHP family)